MGPGTYPASPHAHRATNHPEDDPQLARSGSGNSTATNSKNSRSELTSEWDAYDGPMPNPFDRYDDRSVPQSYEYDYEYHVPGPAAPPATHEAQYG